MWRAQRGCVFSALSGVAIDLPRLASTMNENSNPRSANLGVFVVIGVVPIVVYVTAVLVLPWLVRVFP